MEFYIYHQKLKTLKYITLFTIAALVALAFNARAQEEEAKKDVPSEEVVLDAIPIHSNGIFKNREEIKYQLKIENKTAQKQSGKLSYIITTDEGKNIFSASGAFVINGRSSRSMVIKTGPKPTGFYHINFMFNLTTYDDTLRKVFGVAPEKIISALHKPADFDEFWQKSREDLAAITPRYKVVERRDLSTKEKKVYLVEMHSYGDLLIRGWLVIPTDGKKFPVHYRVPGYVVELKPNMDNDDFIAFDINVRGNGNSKDVVNINTDNYAVTDIDDRNKYIYRGVYMDCLRGLDFLCSHADMGIDTSKIFVEGGSQGGSLAIITAALDKRVKVLTMQVPLYADIHDGLAISEYNKEQVFPFKVFRRYIKQRPSFTWDKFFNTWDYYDPQNFATMVKCPVLMGIGLLDQFCPPRCSMSMFNHLASTEKEFVCIANSTHEVNFNYFMFQNNWLREKLRIP